VAPNQTEVEDDRAERAVRLEVAHYLLQVLQGRLRPAHRKAFCLLDDGAVPSGTDETRDAPDAGRDFLRQVTRKRVDGDEVLGSKGRGYRHSYVGGHVAEITGVEGRLSENDGEVRGGTEAQAVQYVDEQCDGGRVFSGACGAHHFHSGLVELGALSASNARAAIGGQDVGELVGLRAAREALGHEAGYRGRHLRPQQEHLVIPVEELVGGVAEARLLYHLRVLQGGGDDLPEPEQPEAGPDLRLHVEQARGLRR
jgi:hypothetical protein